MVVSLKRPLLCSPSLHPSLRRAISSCLLPPTPGKSFLISGTVTHLGQQKGISQTIDLRINILLFPQMPHLTAIVYISTPKIASRANQSFPGP